MIGHHIDASSHAGCDARLRRLLARRRRVLAMLRAGRRAAPQGYRSRYAASLWALAQDETAATRDET